MTDETSSRRKSTPGDASMRRSIQDLVVSIDPNIKIEPEVEDVRELLSVLGGSRIHFVYISLPPPSRPLHRPTASFGHCR